MSANKRKQNTKHARSDCPVACTLDIVGDKWTLLVLRDLLLGKRRYGEFLESSESITTNILADRLKRLHEHGLVTKEAYQQNPPRHSYYLTDKGRDIGPIIRELIQWGETHIDGTRGPKKAKGK